MKNVYFLGVGGIGMSALARYFKARGAEVNGYDKTPTALTAELEAEGIGIHYDEDIAVLPHGIELVVHTPAVPISHVEYQHFLQQGIPILKRAELLGWITEGMFTIAVAGTHGKTSVTSMITHLLKSSGVAMNAFIGGIPINSGNNLEFDPRAGIVVTEADEFDRSFLHLKPDITVVTAVDADHLDIYGNYETLKETFGIFVKNLKADGNLIHHRELSFNGIPSNQTTTYGLSEADATASDVRVSQGKFCFEMHLPQQPVCTVEMQVPGVHNVENALAAATVASKMGIGAREIAAALGTFKGVRRRFEIHVNTDRIKYVDDYAHHPDELKACISAARDLWPGWLITGIFQPHLYSRTRDLATGFIEVLNRLDAVILLPIYPARELPIPGVDSEMLLRKLEVSDKRLLSLEKVAEWAKGFDQGVLITMGAGNIDLCVEPLRDLLSAKSLGGAADE